MNLYNFNNKYTTNNTNIYIIFNYLLINYQLSIIMLKLLINIIVLLSIIYIK